MDARYVPTYWLKVNKTFSELDEFDLEDDGKNILKGVSFFFRKIANFC